MNHPMCIFCKLSPPAVSFTSEEHIISSALGNADMILSPGIVCDTCNHGKLARLDSALLDFLPVKLMRTLGNLPNRRGSVPKSSSANSISISRNDEILHVNLPNKNQEFSSFDKSSLTYKLNFKSHQPTSESVSMVARSLLKVVFEAIAYQKGSQEVLKQKYDDIRQLIILGDQQSSGYVCMKFIQSHEACFEINYEIPGFFLVRLHDLVFRVGLIDEAFDKKYLVNEASGQQARVLFW